MGIKNIHIVLISCSVAVAGAFGFWALNHAYQGLGYVSLVAAVALVVYGVTFLNKVKSL